VKKHDLSDDAIGTLGTWRRQELVYWVETMMMIATGRALLYIYLCGGFSSSPVP